MRHRLFAAAVLFIGSSLGGCGAPESPDADPASVGAMSQHLTAPQPSGESGVSEDFDGSAERIPNDPSAARECCYASCSNNGVTWTSWYRLGTPDYGHCKDRAYGYCSALRYRYYKADWRGC